jgi:hypothetical protein
MAARMQAVYPFEQALVQADRALVGGEARRHHALHGLQGRAGFARGEIAEQQRDAREQPAGPVERGKRVVEVRRLRVRGDRFDLRQVRLHRQLERGFVMRRIDLLERRQAVRARPFLQQRVVGAGVAGPVLHRSRIHAHPGAAGCAARRIRAVAAPAVSQASPAAG